MTSMRTFSLPAMFSYVALAGTAFAAPSVWDGGSTSGIALWPDPVNWAGNALPPVSADVEFGTGFASGKNVIVDENHVLRSLTFRNAPSNLHLTYDFGGPGTLYRLVTI
jgi:hypothetical protein